MRARGTLRALIPVAILAAIMDGAGPGARAALASAPPVILDPAGRERMAAAALDPAVPAWQREVMGELAGVPAAPVDSSALPPPPLATAGPQLTLPAARHLHSSTYDPIRQRLIVFAGTPNQSSFFNDVWTFSLVSAPAWTPLTVEGVPPTPRSSHSAIYDPVRDRILVFGGYTGPRVNDLWELSLGGTPTWTQLTPLGTPPSPRNLHTAIYDPVRDRMIVFGGYSTTYHNDLWQLSLSGTPTWTQLAPAGPLPPVRRQHAAIYDPIRDRMIISGGMNTTQLGDVWALPLSGAPVWTQLSPLGTSPLPNDSHSAIYDPGGNRMVVFGGIAPQLFRNDSWALSLAGDPTWTFLPIAGALPPGRILHGAILDAPRRRMVVFGGHRGVSELNDTWALALGGPPGWTKLSPPDAQPLAAAPTFPEPVQGLPPSLYLGQSFTVSVTVRNDGLASDDGRIVVAFPGLTAPGDAARVAALAGDDTPGFRTFPAGAAIEDRDCAPATTGYLIAEYADADWSALGGETNTLTLTVEPPALGTFIVDVRATMRTAGGGACAWVSGTPGTGVVATDPQGWPVQRFSVIVNPAPPPGPAPRARMLHRAVLDAPRGRMLVFGGDAAPASDETWALSLAESPVWSLVVPSGTPPTPRRAHTAVLDPVRERMLVFGGTDGGADFGDLWALDLAGAPSWQRLTPAGTAPAPRAFHAAVYDPLRDRMLVFGGSHGVGYFGDLWALELAGSPVWTQLAPAGGGPSPRAAHGAVYDPIRDRILVYGGSSASGLEGDLWALSLADPPAWTLLRPWLSTAGPDPRTGQTMSYDVARDRLWFTGGLHGPTMSNDVWSLGLGAGANWRAEGTWGSPMSARHSHSAVLDPAGDRLVVFGGYDAVGHSDGTWFLSLSEPPTWQALGAPPPPPPPDVSIPVFTAAVAPSAATIVLGQTFTLALAARNDGLASDDGRLVVSFPAFTDPADAGRVSGAAAGDQPGYFEHPAGATLEDVACQPGPVPYLVAEYRDDDWRAFGTETNTLTLTVLPRETGTFVFDVRSTMRERGGDPCGYVNGLPAGGEEGLTDAQGWPVRRFSVTVLPAPTTAQPVFIAPVAPVPASIAIGQSFSLTVTVRNDGAAASDGRIVVGLPAFTGVADVQFVTSGSTGDSPGYREFPAGTALLGAACQSVTASYLVVEYVDNDWTWLGSETNTFTLTATPQAPGPFVLEVRSTARTAGAVGCAYVNGTPAEGEAGPPDQQGWSVRRFTVNVLPAPPGASFTLLSVNPPTNITLGGIVSVAVTVNNMGAASDDGRISLTFPTLTGAGDAAYASSTSGGDSPGYREFAAGQTIARSDCAPMTAGHLTVEYADASWLGGGGESNPLVVNVVPQALGPFQIQVRATMRITGAGPCDYINDVPGQGTPGTDQQGWPVRVFTVMVDPVPGPVPAFIAPVAGIPASIPLGENFRITASLANNGPATDDGRIAFGFRALVGPGDGQWVASASAGDQPGVQIRLPGSVIANTTCQPIGAEYLVAEYVDAAWASGEVNTFSVVVQPPAAGTFVVEVRGIMRNVAPSSGPCLYVGVLPSNGASGFVDQQGWAVRRFTVNVVAPPEPLPSPTASWSLFGPLTGGPTARGGASAVYHPGRQALLLYGGADPVYQSDVWTLPLATGAGWSPITPGGPVPLRRTLHSMILNPIEDQLVIFAGIYDDFLNDMTVLTLGGVPWWFPNPGSGTRPSPRGGHTAVYDPLRHRMLVIGGYDGTLRNDVWEYAPPGTGVWRPLAPAGTPMPGRAQHAAVYDPVRDRVIVFGGDGGGFLGDVWALHLAGGPRWEALAPTGTPPSARREHSLIYDPVGDRVILYGGFDGARRGDVWALSLGGTPAWSRIYAATVSPASRAGHAAVYDPPRRRMVVFGGDLGAGEWSREVWGLGFDLVTPVTLSLAASEATPERVRLVWAGGEVAGLRALVERTDGPGAEWGTLGVPWVEGGDRLVYEDRAVTPGARYGYRLTVWEGSEATVLEPAWVRVPERRAVSLAGASPNPAEGALTVALTLAGEEAARLELYDLEGRRVAAREVGTLGAGAHRVRLAEALPAGVYLVRLVLAGRTLTAKACVVR